MEDWNLLAADCIVISCCCQCLILQILIFILLKLPCKLVQKTKEYARNKLRNRKEKKKEEEEEEVLPSVRDRFQDELVAVHEGRIRIQVKEFHGDHGSGSCIKEVEKVLEELYQQGEFAFGSFWGRKVSGSSSTCVDVDVDVDGQESDFSIVELELVEIVGYSY